MLLISLDFNGQQSCGACRLSLRGYGIMCAGSHQKAVTVQFMRTPQNGQEFPWTLLPDLPNGVGNAIVLSLGEKH